MINALLWQPETNGPRKPGKTWLNFFLAILLVFSISGQMTRAQSEVSADTYLEPYESIEMASVLSGVIKSIAVKEGDIVKKGETLLTLRSDVIEAQYEVAKSKAETKGRVMAAQAEYDQQNNRYSMVSSLRSANSAERKQEYAKLKALEGNLLAAKEDSKISQLEALQIRAQLEERILRSPIDGYIVGISADVAEPVGLNRSDPDKPNYLIRIVKISTLKATAFIPYKAARHVKVGDDLTVRSSDVDEEWETKGKVEYKSPIINAATGTVEIRVAIENPDLEYTSGTPAKIIVTVPVNLSAK